MAVVGVTGASFTYSVDCCLGGEVSTGAAILQIPYYALAFLIVIPIVRGIKSIN